MAKNFKFNPHPTDVFELYSDSAHYIDDYETTKKKRGNEFYNSRWFTFVIGHSGREQPLHDKYKDDKALELLRKYKGKRLIVKGYSQWAGKGQSTHFHIITHFAIFHRHLKDGVSFINPETGEEDSFYKLRT